MWALLVSFGVMLTSAYGAGTPYYESFESGVGTDWAQHGPAALATSSEAVVGDDSLSVEETGAKLSISGNPTNVVVHMIIKAAEATALPALDTNVAAAVVVHDHDDDSVLNIWLQEEGATDDWTNTTQAVSAGDWFALAVHLNYDGGGDGTYNVYYAPATEDGGLIEDLTLIGGPIDFPADYAEDSFTSLVVTQMSNTGTCLVDAVAVDTLPAARTVASANTNMLVLLRPSAGGFIGVPPYEYSGLAREVSSNSTAQLGFDLGVGLNTGDTVDTLLSGGWENHVWHIDDYWASDDVTQYDSFASFKLIRAGGSVDTLALYPYDPSYDPGLPTVTFYGTGNGTYGGVTESVPVPSYRSSSETLEDLLPPGPVARDKVFFPQADGTYESIMFNGSAWSESRTLAPGQTMIYMHYHNDDF
jgi:hypothetical protein